MIQKLILTIIFLTSINLEAQTEYSLKHKFTYLLTYQPDSTDISSKQSEEMLLLTNKNVSIFQSKNGYIKDSLLLTIKNEPAQEINMLDISKFPKTQFHYKILKENSKDSITVYDKIYTDNFRYSENKKNIHWEINSDTLTINGLKCQKATTSYSGRDYEAWFSNEIPISDGPYKFCGLPGLIVKISDFKRHYVFELTAKSEINQLYSNLKPTRNLFTTSKSVFFDKLKDYKKNIIERIAESGFTVDDEYKLEVKRKLRKRNNPIELENH
jgi:GLPGLI family protein